MRALRCLSFAYKEDLAEFATYDREEHPDHKYLLDPAYYSSIESISDILWFCWSKGETFSLHGNLVNKYAVLI